MITPDQRLDAIEAAYDFDMTEAIIRHNQAMADKTNRISVEDAAEKQRKLINKARWELSQGWHHMAAETLEGI